ncbi:MAG: hypothetical protein RLZZ227_609 [Pseudomonadota bacterium]
MNKIRWESRILAAILVALSAQQLPAQDLSRLDAAAGKALFERNWVAAPASTTAADGLGPYYTARSCAACHADGAGSADISALNLVIDDPVYGHLLQPRAVTGMAAEARAQVTWNTVRTELLSEGTVVQLRAASVTVSEWQYGPSSLPINLRRAPALGGLAALEHIAPDRVQLLADEEDRDGDGISGRLPRGRFGWTAATPLLREQVARALSADLGLSTSVFGGGEGDCTAHQATCQQQVHPGEDPLEAPDTVLDLLLAYLRTLPAPASPIADSPGATLFSELGCKACHVPAPDSAQPQLRPYSDLLLHDMGSGLADAGPAGASEWRTAPLWGLRQNAGFLHDGRARTLDEAILWHDGEAQPARDAYRRLNADQRTLLHTWLLGL